LKISEISTTELPKNLLKDLQAEGKKTVYVYHSPMGCFLTRIHPELIDQIQEDDVLSERYMDILAAMEKICLRHLLTRVE
jgi:hypothetical protein